MAEGSGALLDRLDQVMADEFNAKMLGRAGRVCLAEIKFLKRTPRWHVQETHETLGLTDTRAVTKTRTPERR